VNLEVFAKVLISLEVFPSQKYVVFAVKDFHFAKRLFCTGVDSTYASWQTCMVNQGVNLNAAMKVKTFRNPICNFCDFSNNVHKPSSIEP
jgi:hypothetical protein